MTAGRAARSGAVNPPRGRARRPAGVPAARHAPDEHALVEEPVAHPDAVAEDRAAGERARRVDRDDGDAVVALAVLGREARDERALAATGRTGDADDAGLARQRVQLAQHVRAAGLVVLDDREQARDAALITGARAREQRLRGGDQDAATRSRAMTMRWISLVPSPISISLRSRTIRSPG